MCVERIDAGLEPACVLGCPTRALTIVDLATLKTPKAEQYPPGFPRHTELNPSTRFIRPTTPKLALAEKDS